MTYKTIKAMKNMNEEYTQKSRNIKNRDKLRTHQKRYPIQAEVARIQNVCNRKSRQLAKNFKRSCK